MATQSFIIQIDENDGQQPTELDPASNQTTIVLMDMLGVLGHGIGDTLGHIHRLGLQPTEIAVDLTILASAVYAADKQIKRRTHSQDSWSREINLHVPVSDQDLWATETQKLETALHFLTGDYWRIRFHSRPQGREILAPQVEQPALLIPDCISLFSGGLDSFIGVIDLLSEGRNPVLVSHGWVSSDTHCQRECLSRLKDIFRRDEISHLPSRIGFKNNLFGPNNRRENTERSRSFLFFSLASLVASAIEPGSTIFVPENGLISLNIPIDFLRLGSLSTRTTHPYFLARFNEILRNIGISTHLENPYRHKTKGEMVRECRNQGALRAGIANTVSCSAANKIRFMVEANRPANPQGQRHCGWCVPCIIRRAAIQTTGIVDPTPYVLENIEVACLDSRLARGTDVRSFQLAINRLGNSLPRARVIIHETGPLSDFPNEIEQFAEMYYRGMAEVERLIGNTVVAPNV